MKVHQADFSQGKVSSLILRVSFPLIVAELVNLLYNMVDRIYIGHLAANGSLALTGLGLCFPVISLISAFAKLFGSNGGAPLCAMARGRKDEREASLVMGNSFMLSVVTGAVLMTIVLIFHRPILYAFGASDATYPYARDYLIIYSLGTIPVLVTLSMNAFINSQGFATIGMVTVLIGAVINIVLDPIFIFVFGLGVKGAAIATVFSQTVSCIFAVSFLCGKSVELKLRFRDMRLDARRCKEIIALGTSGFTMGATNSLVQLVCNKCAFIWGGDLYVGVMTILNSVREIYSTVINGIGGGSTPVMSFNYGAKNTDRIRQGEKQIVKLAFLFCLVMFLISQTVSGVFVRLFTQNAEYIQLSVWAIRVFTFGVIPLALQYSFVDGLTALGIVRVSVSLSVFRKVAFLVLTLTIPAYFGATAAFYAEPIVDIFCGLFSTAVFLSLIGRILRKREQMPDGQSLYS